eukprot:CAMPEP_0197880488 /NCGR_PEP_ID=MMETSP1439-20131203/8280_1 /TAXON_ID=66791 /ORGANISM="Gonyaulax spinifera, Strain CCMP409" /LENGTH=36 /DNA_ID= /DNA_START= /DNA_END= /DNA_ORIENTATION=
MQMESIASSRGAQFNSPASTGHAASPTDRAVDDDGD